MPEVEKTFTQEEIRAQVSRVLSSPSFRSSKRCARFLGFIVTETLEGRASTLKERTLATEVFDRPISWGAGDDTIVRVGAREVRKRLAQFYAGPAAQHELLRIDLPLGSYVPEFTRLEAGQEAASFQRPLLLSEREPRVQPLKWKRLRIWILVAALLVLAPIGWYFARSPTLSGLDSFWDPYVRSSEPIIIAVAHPIVYEPSRRAYEASSRLSGHASLLAEPLSVPNKNLTGADFIPRADEFLAFGDSVAATALQILFAQRHKDTHLRFASKVEFADLREAPAILIGAFSNRWTVQIIGQDRFHFGYNDKWQPAILDFQRPARSWTSREADGTPSPNEDYFLVCRLANSPSGNIVVAAAGISHLGTQAAGRFLVNEQPLTKILNRLPRGWARMNVQLVMHTRVIGNSPGTPELVASYVW